MFVIVRKKAVTEISHTYEVFGGFSRTGQPIFTSLDYVSIGTDCMIFTTRYGALASLDKVKMDEFYGEQVIFATEMASVIDMLPENDFDSQDAIGWFNNQNLLA